MVSQVTLGNFFTFNGKNVLGGAGGSGLDTQTLINSLVTAKSAPATADQSQITTNGKITTALNTFQSLLSTFQSAADALRNPPGVGNAASNVFQFTTGSVSGAGSSYVSVTTSPGAALQTYNISAITQLASPASQSSGVFTVASATTSVVSANPISGTALQFAPGTITVNGQNITLNEGDSLNTVAADFNAVSTQTGISATVIQLATGQYQLSFTSNNTGAANSFNLASASTVTSDPSGVLSNIGLTEQQTTGAFTVTSVNDSVVPPATGTVAFNPGTLNVPNIGGGTSPVVIASGDSLATIAASFNAVSGSTGVAAHVLQLDSGSYALSFTATQAGASTPFDLSAISDPDGVLTSAGLSGTHAPTTPVAGQDAHFSINGLAVTRPSNTVSDLITGLTFNLLQKTPDNVTNYAVSVQADTTTIQNTIVNFVNAYNAIKTFSAQQTQLNSDGTYASTALLANNTTFRQTMNDINQEVGTQVSGVSNNFNSLADVGVTFINQPASGTAPEVDNILNINDSQLSSALATNFNDVKNLFGFNLTSDSPNLVVFSHTNALSVANFTINADPTNNVFTATYTPSGGVPTTINLTATALSGASGYTLSGPSGSVLDGLQLIYATNATETIHVTATQGIADTSYNSTNAALTANTGTLAVALQSIQSSNKQLNTDITNVNQQVSQYQQQLLAKFSALEQAISKVNNLLSSITANENAQLASSGVNG